MAHDGMTNGQDRLLSLREVATLTGTPYLTVRRWVDEKRIRVERVGPTKLPRVRIRVSVLREIFPHLNL